MPWASVSPINWSILARGITNAGKSDLHILVLIDIRWPLSEQHHNSACSMVNWCISMFNKHFTEMEPKWSKTAINNQCGGPHVFASECGGYAPSSKHCAHHTLLPVIGDAPLAVFSCHSQLKQLWVNWKNDTPLCSRVMKNCWSLNCCWYSSTSAKSWIMQMYLVALFVHHMAPIALYVNQISIFIILIHHVIV